MNKELDSIRPAMQVEAYYDAFKQEMAEMSEETRVIWERYSALLKERGQEAVPQEWLEKLQQEQEQALAQ